MLDAIAELLLSIEALSTQQQEDCKVIHEALLVINKLWKDADGDDVMLMANIFHELRQPMNAVLGFAKVLKMEIDGEIPEALLPHLNRLETQGELLLQIVNYNYGKYKTKIGG
jgi:signal transduction histidine kinase